MCAKKQQNPKIAEMLRETPTFLRDFEVCCEEASLAGLTMSSELKGIFALIFSQSTKLGTSQVLAGMQAHADQNHLDGVDYETVAGLLQSVSDTHQLPNSDTRSGPRQTFLTLGDAEAGESVASDDNWQGTLSDEEDLGEENAEDEQYGERFFALVARYMNKKGKGGKGAGPKGGRRKPGPKGPKQESTKKCEHCNRLGHTKDQCYVLHPELVPDDQKESWKAIMAAREKRKKDKKVYTCISAHVFNSFKSLTDASPTMVITDTGAEGKQFVAGTTWTNNYFQSLPSDAPKPKLTVPTGNVYKFGPTARKTIRTWHLPIWWDGRWTSKRLDEVKGNIPGLLTYDLQADMKVVPCPTKDKLYRMTGETENGLTLEEVKSAKIGGLLALDLIGRDGKGDASAPQEAKRKLRTLHINTHVSEIEYLVAEAETPRTTVATALVYSSNATDATEPERDERASPEKAQKNAGQVQTILVGKRTLEETTLTGQGADEKKQRSDDNVRTEPIAAQAATHAPQGGMEQPHVA